VITTPLQMNRPSASCMHGWVKLRTLIATQREGMINPGRRTGRHPIKESSAAERRVFFIATSLLLSFSPSQLIHSKNLSAALFLSLVVRPFSRERRASPTVLQAHPLCSCPVYHQPTSKKVNRGGPSCLKSALFWDIGGVLLTNAWDREPRERAIAQFKLDEKEFADRHEMIVSSFERGKISLDEYLDRTIFSRPRPFAREAFKNYMFSLSQPCTETLALARELAKSGKYLMATINNESKELHQYRIQNFGLRGIFTLFVSPCFVGLRKQEEGIYLLVLEITQKPADECCFIDDRALNLECARKLGMDTIESENAEQMMQYLRKLGVAA
jgi:putative hydrolase of the HAD superfamily